jgi:hypothetical protein
MSNKDVVTIASSVVIVGVMVASKLRIAVVRTAIVVVGMIITRGLAS